MKFLLDTLYLIIGCGAVVIGVLGIKWLSIKIYDKLITKDSNDEV